MRLNHNILDVAILRRCFIQSLHLSNSFIENGRPRRRIAGNLYRGDAYTGSSAAYLVSRKGARKMSAGGK